MREISRLANLARVARTAALRLISPAEQAWRHARRQPALPPLWLRRHTGPVAEYERAAAGMAEFLDRFGVVSTDSVVLDAGCGVGAMVPHVLSRLGPQGRYVGFDVHVPSIRWCRSNFAAESRLEFHVAHVASAYGSRRAPAAAQYRFPMPDSGADLVLAKSLFTHLLPEDAVRYLAETRRVLRPGKAAVVTAFLFDASSPAAAEVAHAFPYGDESGRVRWRSWLRPASAVAYAKPLFAEMIRSAGLNLQWHWPGYHPGAARPTGQDVLLIGH